MEQVRQILQCESPPVDGQGVRIAILDTGIDEEHPDFTRCLNRVESRTFCLSMTGELTDRHGHGTHVAGIIAGSGAASEGKHRGIAPGAEIFMLRISSDMGGLSADVAAAVVYAVDELKVDIINYSGGENAYGTAGGPPPWKWSAKLSTRDRAFQYAIEQGVLCVAAAGNDGPARGSVVRPGNLKEVLCVGATAPPDYEVAEESARGPVHLANALPRGAVVGRADEMDDTADYMKPDVVAPGSSGIEQHHRNTDLLIRQGIYLGGPVSCRSRHGRLAGIIPSDPECLYARCSGTSQATAVVSGLAALTLELGRKMRLDWGDSQGGALRAILKEAARPLASGSPHDYGNGTLLWPTIMATVEDCAGNPVFRDTVLRGRQLRLEL